MSFPNRYAGKCHRCGAPVAAGAGWASRLKGRFVVECQPKCAPKVAPTATVGDLSAALALFRRAGAHIEFPSATINVADQSAFQIRIQVAGERSRFPGSLSVLTEARDANGERAYLGRITADGVWHPSRTQTDGALGDAILARLRQFARDPARVVAEYGRLRKECSFCRIALTDARSRHVGYGQKCASNYGLPWGERPGSAEFFGEAV